MMRLMLLILFVLFIQRMRNIYFITNNLEIARRLGSHAQPTSIPISESRYMPEIIRLAASKSINKSTGICPNKLGALEIISLFFCAKAPCPKRGAACIGQII